MIPDSHQKEWVLQYPAPTQILKILKQKGLILHIIIYRKANPLCIPQDQILNNKFRSICNAKNTDGNIFSLFHQIIYSKKLINSLQINFGGYSDFQQMQLAITSYWNVLILSIIKHIHLLIIRIFYCFKMMISRKPQDNKIKLIQAESPSKFNNISSETTKNNLLQKKLFFPQKLKSQSCSSEKINLKEPLNFSESFSKRSVSKSKFSKSRQTTSRSINKLQNKATEVNRYICIPRPGVNNNALLKQNEQLQRQHKLLISHLIESRSAFQNLNKMYQKKCEQTETLKSIINSLKEYIHSTEDFQNRMYPTISPIVAQRIIQRTKTNTLKQKQKKGTSTQRKEPQSSTFRRTSIRQNIVPSFSTPVSRDQKEPTGFDQFVSQKYVESIKGSAYQLQSYKQI